MLLTSLIVMFSSIRLSHGQTHVLTPIYKTEGYISNTYDTISASVSPAISTNVRLYAPWLSEPGFIENPSGTDGMVSFSLKFPKRGTGTYEVTFRSPDTVNPTFPEVKQAITVKIGVQCVPSYESYQSYDPEPTHTAPDIAITATFKETDYNSTIKPDSYPLSLISGPACVTSIQCTPKQLSVGTYLYEIILKQTSYYTKPLGAFVFEIAGTKNDPIYVTMTIRVSITVQMPKILIKVEFEGEPTSTAYIGKDAGTLASQGTRKVHLYMLNTKLTPLHGVVINSFKVEIEGWTDELKYDLQQVDTNDDSHYTFTYNINVPYLHLRSECTRPEYEDMYATLNINTYTGGFDIRQWVLNPYIMVPLAILGIAIIAKILSKKKSSVRQSFMPIGGKRSRK